MPAALKIILTSEEDRTLKELELADRVPRRTKQRATVLRLNSRGWTVKAIANYLECAASTVRGAIRRWELKGSKSDLSEQEYYLAKRVLFR